MVNGIKSGREMEEGDGFDRPFSHIEKIILKYVIKDKVSKQDNAIAIL